MSGINSIELYSTVGQGAATVAASGTAGVLASTPTPASLVMITANSANTGRVAFGDASVVAANNGGSLGAGETVVLPVPQQDLSKLFAAVTVNGEGVKYTYFK